MSDRPMGPEGTAGPGDPLVDRLRAELGRRAGEATVPEQGLDLVRHRVHRRHRNRQLLLGGGALAVVLVVLLAGLSALARDDDRAVVTGGSTMPFLGFANDTWQVVSYAPGTWYGVVDDMGQPSERAVHLLVTNDALSPETVRITRVRERTLENMRGDLEVGRLEATAGDGSVQQVPGVWWSPAPGWTATLTGNSTDAFPDAEALLAAADAVVDVDRPTWEARLRSGVGEPTPISATRALVLPSPGRTQLLSATLDNVAMWLEPADGAPGVLLQALGPGTEWSRDGTEQPVQVRDASGWLHTGPDAPEPSVSWTEGGRTYVLGLAPAMTTDEAVAFAERLALPTPEEWERLLFPAEPQPYPEELRRRFEASAPSTAPSP